MSKRRCLIDKILVTIVCVLCAIGTGLLLLVPVESLKAGVVYGEF